MKQEMIHRAVLVLVLIAISLFFLAIVKPFLVSIFLAALFATLFHPLYERILSHLGGRNALASAATMLIAVCFVFIPISLILAAVVSQALELAAIVRPWVQKQFTDPEAFQNLLHSMPFYEQLLPFQDVAEERLGGLVGVFSASFIDFLQVATVSTFSTILMVFIVLYTMFFFLMDGDRLLYYVLYYLPLRDEDEKKLLVRFKSVTRATLKGTAVIGFLQGTLAGLALWIGGVPSALFLAVTMMFLSVVPGIGTALVWIPAVIYIAIYNSIWMAIGVAAFCGVVVGLVDNILRPKLVGNDTQLHELLIFFSTLGGLLVFGFWGFVIGPIIAALFVTVWELYGEEFNQWLPTTAFVPSSGSDHLPGLQELEYRNIASAELDETGSVSPGSENNQPGGSSSGGDSSAT